MAKDTERWRLISFDIRDPSRYRRVIKVLKGYAVRVQYSVFRSRLDDRQSERMRWELAREMSPEDALLILDLCPHCAERVVAKNQLEDWTTDPPAVIIIGGEQASPDGTPPSPPEGDQNP